MTSALVTSVLQLVAGEQPSPGLVEAVTSLVDTTVRPHTSHCTIATDVMVTGHPLQCTGELSPAAVLAARHRQHLPRHGHLQRAAHPGGRPLRRSDIVIIIVCEADLYILILYCSLVS